MAVPAPQRNTPAFAVLMAATVAAYFAFTLYAAWVILQYGVKTADFGWQIQRIGQHLYVVSIEEKGPATGSLEIGDRIVAINGEPVRTEGELGIALKSVAGAGLYGLRVQRTGTEREIWLRSRTRAGFSFFQHRLPLLGSSVLIFFCGLAMLLRWNSAAARYGFLASSLVALRLGAWAILPLSTYFQTREFLPLFLFCLPAGLAIPLAYQSLLCLGDRRRVSAPWDTIPWVLAGLWILILVVAAPPGAIPAPVPEGLAFLYAGKVEYRQSSPVVQYGIPLYICLAVLTMALWIRRLYRNTGPGDLQRRMQWILLSGGFFALPAGIFEVTEWLGIHSGATGWNWLLALLALSYQHILSVERITSPAMVLRGAMGRLLPEPVFRKLDMRWFPPEAEAEQRLRAIANQLDACTQVSHLAGILTHGLEEAVGAAGFEISEGQEAGDFLPISQKLNGETYTRRERRLIENAVSHFFASQERLRKKEKEKGAEGPREVLNLMRECPRCGACYDSEVVLCPHDQEVPVLRLPIERVVDGKYVLERLIGRGGMGAVYEARDRRLNRRVALKVMLSELFGQQAALQRFEREAQLAAKISHPNIVQIHDFGPIGAMGAYQVMEYVEGRSWREELAGGAVPAALCMNWIEQLLDGIEAAHACGIIHRDLKPENLLLEERGHGRMQVKILDFGLAKMQLLNLSREEHLSIGVNTIGTVGYVPPEQLTGGATDERSDIYAIGRIVAEVLTGALPEDGCPGLDPALAAVVMKCTALRKEDRYECIGELRGELLAAMRQLEAH